MIIEYYQKNPNAAQSIKSGLYEDKIINLIKSKIKISIKSLTTSEAEKLISSFNKPANHDKKTKSIKPRPENKAKSKKISKK